MDIYAEYTKKFVAPEEAVKVVKSGDWVDYSQCCSFPEALDTALAQRKDELRNVNVRHALSVKKVQIVEHDPEQKAFTYNLWHCSGLDRSYLDKGRAYYEPMLFRNCGSYYSQKQAPVNVAMITVAPMDKNGNFSYGLTNCCQQEMLNAADTVIVEVNSEMPVIAGTADDHIHIGDVDYIVEGNSPLPVIPNRPAGEIDKKIAEHIFLIFMTA